MPEEASASDWIICVDESGDLGLRNFNSKFPIFLVAMVIFERDAYDNEVVPAFESLKREFFGHAGIPLHEIDIRRGIGPIRTLRGHEQRREFRVELRKRLSAAPFKITAAWFDKRTPPHLAAQPGNLYYRCFLECAVPLRTFLPDLAGGRSRAEMVVESRGDKEDAALRRTIEAIETGEILPDLRLDFDLRFAGKRDLNIGVEIADLVANPIARHVLELEQPSLPFDLIQGKFLGPDGGLNPESLINISTRQTKGSGGHLRSPQPDD